MSNFRRRKNYFIKKKFQANFFVKFALLLLLEAVLIAGLFMYVSKGTLTTAYRGTELIIQKTDLYFLVSFLLISLIVGVAIGIVGIFVFMYLSHRIGGPLYRFEKTVEETQKGDLAQRIQLRKTDQIIELKEKMNTFLEDMDSRISNIKGQVQEGLDIAAKTEVDSDKIKKILEKIKTSLEHFKTSK